MRLTDTRVTALQDGVGIHVKSVSFIDRLQLCLKEFRHLCRKIQNQYYTNTRLQLFQIFRNQMGCIVYALLPISYQHMPTLFIV